MRLADLACVCSALAGLLIVAGCGQRSLVIPREETVSEDPHPVGDFSLTDQRGRAIALADLKGRVWVASFIFTRCCTSCPQISGSLARLQKELKDQKDVVLVSFSVDPEHDTPKVLKEFGDRFGADPERWIFLTGEREKVYRLIRESFYLAVEQNEGVARTPGNEVTHSSRLVLVDRKGNVRGRFDGRQVDEAGQPVDELAIIRKRIDELVAEKPR